MNIGKVNFLLISSFLCLVVNFVNFLAIIEERYYGFGQYIGICMSVMGIILAGVCVYQYRHIKILLK